MQGERRTELLDAALHLFEQRGYAAVTMGDVAAAVGVTKAAVHYYFPTKADLYASVMRDVMEGIARGIRRTSAAPGTVSVKLHGLASFAIVSLKSNADLDAMMRDANEHLDEAQRQELGEAHEAILVALADLMRDGIAGSELAPVDPDFLAHAYWHLLAGFAGRAGSIRGYQGRPEVATAMVELFLHGAGRPGAEEGDM